MPTIFERVFPSLRRSPAVQGSRDRLTRAALENDESVTRFVDAVQHLIVEFGDLRDEVRRKRPRRNGKSTKRGAP